MDQLALEAASGVRQSHIAAIEQGKVPNPTGRTIWKLALGLDVSVGVLYGEEAIRAAESSPPFGLCPASQRLAAVFKRLPPTEREEVADFAEFLLGRRRK